MDSELYEDEIFDYLIDSLNATASENVKDYYTKIISHFKDENSDFPAFFHQRIFDIENPDSFSHS